MTEGKLWYQSRTVWLNIMTAFIASMNELLPLLDIMDPEAAEGLRSLIIMANVFGNVWLRVLTAQPLRLK